MITERKDITTICSNITIDPLSGHLNFAGRDTTVLAKKYGTPLYLIDEEKIREIIKKYSDKYENIKPIFLMILPFDVKLSFCVMKTAFVI